MSGSLAPDETQSAAVKLLLGGVGAAVVAYYGTRGLMTLAEPLPGDRVRAHDMDREERIDERKAVACFAGALLLWAGVNAYIDVDKKLEELDGVIEDKLKAMTSGGEP